MISSVVFTLGTAVLTVSSIVGDIDGLPWQAGEHDWLIKHPTIVELLERHNQERARVGIGPLTLNTDMCLAAQRHADWMAKSGIYQHSSLPYREIIFQGPQSAAGAVAGWIASPAHHSIMLSGSEAGFGYMKVGGRTYWVGVFR